MTATGSRGLLYPTPPEYDVFKRRSERSSDETADEVAGTDGIEAPAGPDERSGPATDANWTGTVPAGD